MNKLQALQILVHHHTFLNAEDKSLLLSRLMDMTEDEQNKLGRFLALAQKKTLAENQQLLDNLDQIEKEYPTDS